MASPATALSQDGHPAATCSPSRLLRRFRSRKLRDAAATATTAFPGSSASSFFSTNLAAAAAAAELRRDEADTAAGSGARSRSTPDESTAGVTETTAFLDATQPISAAH